LARLPGLGNQPSIIAAVQAEVPAGGHGGVNWKPAVISADGRQGFVSKPFR
jgi:hypothetical protein